MKWNAFNLIEKSIGKTKKRIFPFSFVEWIKLAIVIFLAGLGKGSFSPNINYNIGSGDFSNLNGFGVGESVRKLIREYWIIGGIILSIFFVIGLILSYVGSVFSFIFLDSVTEKKTKFTWSKNHSKGVSLFWFRLVFGLISLLIIGALAFPYIYFFMIGMPVVASVGWSYIVFSIIAGVVFLIAIWFILLFVYDFVLPYMYKKNVSAWIALNETWKMVGKNKKEVFVYWIARIVMSIAIGLITLAIVFVVVFVFGLIALLLFLLGVGIALLGIGILNVFLIMIGIILLIIFIVCVLLAIGMVIMPLSVFMRYFSLMNFEKLSGLKILK